MRRAKITDDEGRKRIGLQAYKRLRARVHEWHFREELARKMR